MAESDLTSDQLSPTKRALLALKQLQAKLAEANYAQREPIAVVGLGCRWPGAANPAEFWRLLQNQQDAIAPVPADRWDLDKFYDPDPAIPAKMPHREGGFLPDLLNFDAGFFRIAPREAKSLDPQQRLLLEVSWEALEQGGFAADGLVGSQTGVFVGISSIDYWQRLLSRHPSEIDAYLATGNTHSMAAGRISYILGLTGPSLAMDTACSSSLVALHSACQSLRLRDCDLALAGGVNQILEPATSLNFAKAKMLSPTDRCRSFDAAADGFVRAEGCGVVVLKRWRDALRDQNPIWGVILGSAVNHDGRASGLTVPNGSAQQALIRQALAQAQVEPNQVSYVETHGTGTALGDPIEVNALGGVFGTTRLASQPLILGAVKTNIGHTEAAAGMAGLIKTLLALQHQQIPANLHFQQPNPQIDWSTLPVQVPTVPVDWPQQHQPRIAGVSAFGFSGTNAHLVVADFPIGELPPGKTSSPDLPHYLLPLSAKTQPALMQLIERYRTHLQTYAGSLADLCYTAQIGRCHFSQRQALIVSSLSDLREQLAWVVALVVMPQSAHEAPADLQAIMQQYLAGATIDWSALWQGQTARIVDLPTYPFQRQPYGVGIIG
ncbi:MAG: polyketide synthase [Pegethrix bostrychoides GSE-TBD4-15B]|jgi:acyl transferase domain-containing protein|uniref:Polyketide synthase n=1 Tax=Pegethrix bostrychoides GSE-TBD4-15B TaxID=2839662 RepID=A0A951PB36_9CYAN|nr:polyketide synthase [Pegethrix bostrychoides GSE-TBD4-15B]